MSKIEKAIADIEDYINECKPVPFSQSAIKVDKRRMEELLLELRSNIPDEIKKYHKIISNKEAIIAEAKAQADQMISDATVQTHELINEHEIMQRAYEQANEIIRQANAQAQEIVDNAVSESNDMREAAIEYTDGLLSSTLMVMKHSMEGADEKFISYMNAMKSNYEIVESNLKELRGSAVVVDKQPEPAPAPAMTSIDIQPEYEPQPEEPLTSRKVGSIDMSEPDEDEEYDVEKASYSEEEEYEDEDGNAYYDDEDDDEDE